MADLRNHRLIIAKGFLFLSLGVLSSALLLMLAPRLDIAVLLAIAVWAFCRFYYFAFYVIQNYVDPSYRFAGLAHFARYILKHRRN